MPDLEHFIARVWQEGSLRYRDLPWRNIDDPYQVLVSEVMLQQTQVVRVLGRWERFIALFPSVDALASADTSDVLDMWQGMGYNRRALSLKKTAEICSADYGGSMPESYLELLALPGVGKATAAGVRSFAYRQPSVYLETNVRTVFIHELFPDAESVSDRVLEPLVEASCSIDDPRGWYYALLDYGAYLKTQVANPSRKSAHYTKQSNFEGSRRQKRAEVLRVVLANPGIDAPQLAERLDAFEKAEGRDSVDPALFDSIVADLVKEGFFKQEGSAFTV